MKRGAEKELQCEGEAQPFAAAVCRLPPGDASESIQLLCEASLVAAESACNASVGHRDGHQHPATLEPSHWRHDEFQDQRCRRTPASAGARNGVKGNGTISQRALRCMRKLGCCQTTRPHARDQPERSSSERLRLSSASEPSDSCEVAKGKAHGANQRRKSGCGTPKGRQIAAAAQRQASAGARDGVKGKGAISLRALRCMR